MKKTTIAFFAAAGLFVLTGCRHEVMHDRKYEPAGPQDDPQMKQQAYTPAAQVTPIVEEKKSQPPVQELRYKPMGGSYSNDGIADDAAPRKRVVKSSKRSKATAAKGGVYIVKPGDTLGRIASRNRVSVKALRDANNLDPQRDRFLRVGTKLVIPGGKSAAVKNTGKKSAVLRKSGKKTPKLNSDGTYTMVRGDNIPKVARKFGIRAKALQRANNLTDEETTKLQIGHKLIIPSGDDAVVKRSRKVSAKRPAKKVAAPKAEVKEENPLPPPPSTDDALPAADASAPAASPAAKADAAAELPPAAPVDTVSNVESSSFVSAGDSKTLAEFAAKHNTTVEELCKLNPQLDPAAPLEPNKMLFVPKK